MRLRRYVFTFASPLGTVGFYFCVALGDGRFLLLLLCMGLSIRTSHLASDACSPHIHTFHL